MRRQISLGAMILAAVTLSGCGGLFDEMNEAAAISDQWHAEEDARRAASGTDYVQACNTYGCPSTRPANTPAGTPTRESGCPEGLNGVRASSGTACPQ